MEQRGLPEGGLLGNAHNLTIMIGRYIKRNVQGSNISENTMNDLKEFLLDIDEYKTDINSNTTLFTERQDGLTKQMVLNELEQAKSQILSLLPERDMPGGRRRTRKTRRMRRTRKTRRTRITRITRRSRK